MKHKETCAEFAISEEARELITPSSLNLIVIHTDDYLDQNTFSNVVAQVKGQLPMFQVLILEGGAKISVIRDNKVLINAQEEPPQIFEE